jgi:hypothetical protein
LTTVRAEAQFVDPYPTRSSRRDEGDRPFLDLMATPPHYFITDDKDFDAPQYSCMPVTPLWSLFACWRTANPDRPTPLHSSPSTRNKETP